MCQESKVNKKQRTIIFKQELVEVWCLGKASSVLLEVSEVVLQKLHISVRASVITWPE